MGIKTVRDPPYSPDLAPCDFWLFPKLKEKLRGCRYEIIEDMKEAVTKGTNKTSCNTKDELKATVTATFTNLNIESLKV